MMRNTRLSVALLAAVAIVMPPGCIIAGSRSTVLRPCFHKFAALLNCGPAPVSPFGCIANCMRKRRFHIYSVRSVDQAIEVMTGVRAGRRRGRMYEAQTVNRLVDDALFELAESIKDFVDGSDSASGHPSPQGLADDEDDEGIELRRRRAGGRPAAVQRAAGVHSASRTRRRFVGGARRGSASRPPARRPR